MNELWDAYTINWLYCVQPKFRVPRVEEEEDDEDKFWFN